MSVLLAGFQPQETRHQILKPCTRKPETCQMRRYDAAKRPIPAEWLALDESEQVNLVTAYHRQTREELPNPQVHVVIHVTVENQLAEEIKTVCEALDRLVAEGLDRHEAIHAIGSVLVQHLYKLMKQESTGPNPHEEYFEDLKSLTKKSWLESMS
jgi:hypothetical protein